MRLSVVRVREGAWQGHIPHRAISAFCDSDALLEQYKGMLAKSYEQFTKAYKPGMKVQAKRLGSRLPSRRRTFPMLDTIFFQRDVADAVVELFPDKDALLAEADSLRPDEHIDYNPNRAHLIFGGRNTLMSIIGPDIVMAGPLWAAMQVVVIERYKEGKAAMNSLFGGSGSFRWGTNSGLLLLPIVSLVEPILGIALSLTLLIQGFVSVRIGIVESRSNRDLGIAGIIGAVLVSRGATWAFAVGIILTLLVYGRDFFRGENEKIFTKDLDD